MVRRTAAKCVLAPQMEIMLKVKQADNPEFQFLQPNDECNAYYEWLKQNCHSNAAETKSPADKGGLGLLDTYSSSSDEESMSAARNDTTLTMADPTKETPSLESTSGSGPTKRASVTNEDDNVIAAKRARRLKRARQMSGHYRLHLMNSANPKCP